MNRPLSVVVGVFTLMSLWVVPPATAGPDLDTIAITYVKFPLNVPLIIAKKAGLFEKEFAADKITVQWPELTAGPKQVEAMAAGSVQFASVISADAVITAKANGVDLKVIGVFARAPKAFNVMAKNPEIATVADLKGKTVAGPKGSLLNQTLFAALQQAGLKPADVNFVNMAGAQALPALLSGTVDAALIAGPAQIKAEAQGARVIANGDGLVKGIILTAVAGPFLKNHPDLVKRYQKVHDQAIAMMKADPEKTCDMAATQDFLATYGMMAAKIDVNDMIAR